MEFLLDCSLLYIQVYYLFLFKLQAVHQLTVWLESMSVLFIAYCHSQGNSWQYLPLKGSCPKNFIVHCMGSVNCPFYLHPILLFYLLQILACFLLPLLHLFLRLFPKFFVLLFFFSSIIFNFFLFFSSIPYQTSYYSICITSLLCIFPAVLFYSLLCYFFSLFIWHFLYILLQIYPLNLVHSPSFLLAPKCLPLLYTLSIALDICLFL